MARRVIFAGGSTGTRGGSINLILTDYKKFTKVIKAETRRILEQAGNIVLQETLPLTPVDTGALRESGRVKVRESQRGVSVLVSFGGPDMPVTPTRNAPSGIVDYAVFVHEDIPGSHKHRVGSAKFLQLGGAKAANKVNTFIRNELKKITP